MSGSRLDWRWGNRKVASLERTRTRGFDSLTPKTFLNFSLDVPTDLCIMYLISVMLIVLKKLCVVMGMWEKG